MYSGEKRCRGAACHTAPVRKGEHDLRVGAGYLYVHGIGTVRSGERQGTFRTQSGHQIRRRSQFRFQRQGIGREFRKNRGVGNRRRIPIGQRRRELRLVIGRCIPPVEPVTFCRKRRQRAARFMAQDDPVVCQGRGFGIVQTSGNSYRTFPIADSRRMEIYIEAVSETMFDVERLRKSRIVPDRHGIGHLRVCGCIDSRFVIHTEDIRPGLFRKRKVAASVYSDTVHTERSSVGLHHRDTSPQCQGRGISVNLDGEHL